jgi:hypothetical protein
VPTGPRDPLAFGAHPAGARVEVRHACPRCPLAAPRVFCPTCLGHGSVSEETLARYVRQVNAEALQDEARARTGAQAQTADPGSGLT